MKFQSGYQTAPPNLKGRDQIMTPFFKAGFHAAKAYCQHGLDQFNPYRHARRGQHAFAIVADALIDSRFTFKQSELQAHGTAPAAAEIVRGILAYFEIYGASDNVDLDHHPQAEFVAGAMAALRDFETGGLAFAMWYAGYAADGAATPHVEQQALYEHIRTIEQKLIDAGMADEADFYVTVGSHNALDPLPYYDRDHDRG